MGSKNSIFWLPVIVCLVAVLLTYINYIPWLKSISKRFENLETDTNRGIFRSSFTPNMSLVEIIQNITGNLNPIVFSNGISSDIIERRQILDAINFQTIAAYSTFNNSQDLIIHTLDQSIIINQFLNESIKEEPVNLTKAEFIDVKILQSSKYIHSKLNQSSLQAITEKFTQNTFPAPNFGYLLIFSYQQASRFRQVNSDEYFLQLYGKTIFVLIPPDRRKELILFPSLHPLNGFTQDSRRSIHERFSPLKWNDTVIVTLLPGEILFIPPFWIYEMEAVSTETALVNFDSLLSSSQHSAQIMDQIFARHIPGLSTLPTLETDSVPEKADEAELGYGDPVVPLQLSHIRSRPTARLLLGSLFALEVLYSVVGRNNGARVAHDVYHRYQPILQKYNVTGETLLSEPLIQKYIRALSTWVPRPPHQAFVGWSTWIVDYKLGNDCYDYIKFVQQLARQLPRESAASHLTPLVEHVALQLQISVDGEVLELEPVAAFVSVLGALSISILDRRKK